MDTARGFDDGRVGDSEGLRADGGGHDVLDAALASPPDDGGDIDGGGVDDAAFSLGGDERRMHVRAYNHWVSLLKGRPCPGIDDLDPANIADFGPHSVLIDFTRGIDDPTIAYLGRTLREECGLDAHVVRVADVPGRSLLSRLTDHYLQIIANRAPIGFEAEFVGIRGRTTLYRGILMPFTSDDSTIDFIYGVINWKELADADTQATLAAELDAAVRSAPRALAATPVWADGP
ncbi:PAS domain-containing protein, partial [Sphingomonas aquatilis]